MWDELKEKFPEADIEWRIQQSGVANGKPYGIVLAYLNARAVMDRLDEAVGPGNWWDEYEFIGDTGVLCRLTISTGDRCITKQDGAEMTKVEAFKGGLSSALKRAAVKFGIGRYLYDLPTTFAEFVPKSTRGAYRCRIEGTTYYWVPPRLPKEFLPKK